MRAHQRPGALEALYEEDRFESRQRSTSGRFGRLCRRDRLTGASMHDQLKSWHLQDDVIVITVGFAESEYVGIERGDLVEPFRKQDCART